jgi:hypothetical protein
MIESAHRVLCCLIVNWILLALLAICCAALYAIAPIRLEASSSTATMAFLLTLCALGGHWLFHAKWHRAGICLIAVSQIAILATIGAMASLPIAALTHGYADGALAGADNFLGLDWREYARFAIEHPSFRNVLKTGYFMFVPEAFLIVAYMAFRGHGLRVAIFISAAILAIATSLAGFWLAPAVGTYLHYGASSAAAAYFGINPYEMAGPIGLARSGAMTAHFDALLGLISFPSMHTAGALLMLWLGWREQWLRPAVLPLNLAMIAATPIDGSHYFVDMIAGGATAIAALGATGWLVRATMARSAAHRPSLQQATPAGA